MRPAKTSPRPTPPSGGSAKPQSEQQRTRLRWAALGLVLALALAYANSLSTPFVFDDLEGVVGNTSIRDPSHWSDVLWAPANATGATGRPLVNLSLALNYALGGLDVRGYHVFNLLLHAASALLLLGLVRCTLLLPALAARFSAVALPAGLSVALLWGLHPLLTESVTCVIQRTELLGGFFYLLTLYAFVRSASGDASPRWRIASVAACLLGMAAKETMATAPLIVFFFDRTFVAGSFAGAWRERRGYYLALAATWLPLLALVIAAKNRSGIVGFDLGVSPYAYALTQCKALLLYLKLSFWPHPLVVDYGADLVPGLGAVWWQALVLIALVGGTLIALWRKPWLGFLGLVFFVIIAPSSSILPLTTQTISEHRMYLSLAAVVIPVVMWIFHRLGPRGLTVTLLLALVLGVATFARNQDYRTPLNLWRVTVRDYPDNARARTNYGNYLAQDGQLTEAVAQFQASLRLKANDPDAAFNLGNALTSLGDFTGAAEAYGRALKINPNHAMAHYGLANCLARLGRMDDAVAHFARASQLRPSDVNVLHAYASALAYANRGDEALGVYAEALKLTPQDPALYGERGAVLAGLRRWDEALSDLREAARLAPEDAHARFNLGRLLLDQQRWPEAAETFAAMIRLQPQEAAAYNGLGRALSGQERWDEAIAQFQQACRLQPQWPEPQRNLERAEFKRSLRPARP
ncbi:MAG: tetratricopeptide repeat protein [Verrucomicrobia bacterium]|nr:tetratricopeptide repeat protein [Verrucomicrobiota bacterium]